MWLCRMRICSTSRGVTSYAAAIAAWSALSAGVTSR